MERLVLYPLIVVAGRKLALLRGGDPYKQWWSLDETRFCSRCEHLFIGRDLRLFEDEKSNVHFACPTLHCEGSFADWQYPALHL